MADFYQDYLCTISDVSLHCSFSYRNGFPHQVGIVDLDICGPSVPKLMAVEGESIINSQYGWMPLKYV